MIEQGAGAREVAVGLPAAFLAGLLVGVLGTFKHQYGVSAATGTGLPIGLTASIAMIALLLAALRLAFPTRWFAGAAAAGTVLGGLILLLPGPGGSEVVLLNTAGLAWTVSPAIVAAVVVGWPRRVRRPASSHVDERMDDGRDEGSGG